VKADALAIWKRAAACPFYAVHRRDRQAREGYPATAIGEEEARTPTSS
jgi:hypothetical protein